MYAGGVYKGGYRDSERGWGGGEVGRWRVTITTKLWCIHNHTLDVFSLFMKFQGPPKGGY